MLTLYSLRSFTKLCEVRRILLLKTAVKAKMLTFVLPTEKRLVVLFLTVLNISSAFLVLNVLQYFEK